ncbi:intermembrane transport protein PqiB [Sneathiella limimaris]|uniref:PqiB family protein n=1 Tax=Sneathiella limimaris TaxID=1964213 RepID=UPI00146AEE44|nr:MlaD family protein [Sneathiella limimaris]
MSDQSQMSEPPKPLVKPGYAGLLSIWLIPLLAIGIAGWLIIQSYLQEGAEISIFLPDAKGIEAGVTTLKYRDVKIGTVDRIEIPDERRGVLVYVEIQKWAEKYLTNTARFWVVSPAISLEGISGLETLLSGAYLEIDPGEGGKKQFSFNGLATPPVLTTKKPGKEYILKAAKLGNVKRGTPVNYKGLKVGTILGYRLSEDKQLVELVTFIEEPYTELIQVNTRFWDAGGVGVQISPSGIEVAADSLSALLSGAIEFLPPLFDQNSRIAESGHEFKLFKDRQAMSDARFTERKKYILFFDNSVSGLEVGSPVEFKGIKVGSVREVSLEIHEDTGEYYIPVIIDIEPQRLKVHRRSDALLRTKIGEKLRNKAVSALVSKGLRARLKSTNFLTGQLIVDLDLYPDRPGQYVEIITELEQLPTLPTELEEITTSLSRLVEKVERLPIETLTNSMVTTAQGLEKIFASGELSSAIKEIQNVAVSIGNVVNSVDRTTLPRINEAVEGGQKALRRVDTALQSATTMFETANSTIADGSPLKYDLSVMLRELAAASRSVRNLTEFLERNPNALISGKK